MLPKRLTPPPGYLTKYARTYVVTGDPKYEQRYWDILAVRDGSPKQERRKERDAPPGRSRGGERGA